MIFAVSDDLARVEKVVPASFVALEIWERRHIQQWVSTTPEILGEDLLIVSEEFDRFEGSRDRLDLLALDRQGNLVVVELKRDSAAGYADLQAIRYAAMVSSMSLRDLVPYYVSYRRKHNREEELSPEDARVQLQNFVAVDDFEELSSKPRIILCSEDFSQELTTSVLWLNNLGLDITCIRITPYRHAGKIVIVPTKIIPLQEAKQYQIQIQQKAERQQESVRRRIRTMRVLVENGLITAGQRIFLKNGLPDFMHYDPNDPVYHAEITGKLGQQNNVRWEKDGQEYSISGLTWNIFRDLHPAKQNPTGITGPWHWVTESGASLWSIAEEFIHAPTPHPPGDSAAAVGTDPSLSS